MNWGKGCAKKMREGSNKDWKAVMTKYGVYR